MKILHVSTAVSWRGGEQQIAYLAGELGRKQVAQWVCCPEGSPLQNVCKDLSVFTETFRSRGIFGLALAGRIASLCKAKDVSLVHAHDSHAHTSAVLAATLFGNKIPIVLSRRVDFPVSQNVFSRWKYNHPSIRKIICVSKKIEAVIRRDITDPQRLTVVYDGMDTGKFLASDRTLLRSTFGIDASAPVVGNASALADHKDYFTFVDTAAIVARDYPGIRFVIMGDGPEKENISNYIAAKQLTGTILMTGFRDDVHRLLPSLDVFLMTSVTEGLGSVLLDAFAAGVPVVATAAGGIPEIVHPEETGLLAEVKDSAALATHVLRLLRDPSLAERLRRQAALFVQGFSKEKMAEATLRCYEEVLAS